MFSHTAVLRPCVAIFVRMSDHIALRGVAAVVVVLLVAAVACSPSVETRPEIVPQGRPEVDLQAVARHARQFDEELGDRTAGSQQEEITATYILGHLQQAGYVARLDAVPVADLVRSTNVIAVPPSGEDPSVVVAVPYDSSGDADETKAGRALGVFLEVARALRVADRNHSVEFVALGAERTALSGGHLGVRRLAQFLREEDQHPFVVLIDYLAPAAPFHTEGPGAGALSSHEGDASVASGSPRKTFPASTDSRAALAILTEAGFEAVVVGGGQENVGRALLGFLLDQGS